MKLRVGLTVAVAVAVLVGPAGPAVAQNQMPNVTVRESQKYATV